MIKIKSENGTFKGHDRDMLGISCPRHAMPYYEHVRNVLGTY